MIQKIFRLFRGKKKKVATKIKAHHNPSKLLPKYLINEPLNCENRKIAVSLHIFYDDFITTFVNALQAFPYPFDLFCTVKNEHIKKKIIGALKTVNQVRDVHLSVVPNRGRNIAPLFIEYGKKLLTYDLMCHLHSKKSLYSGTEQNRWANYLMKYILSDVNIVKNVINIFSNAPDLGIYFPTTFGDFPGWVNSWGKNKHLGVKLAKKLGIELQANFINYPVGGMFWARPQAVRQLLAYSFEYDDFPQEPIANDGTLAHTIERMIGYLVEKNGFKQFYYDPNICNFTMDTHHFSGYYKLGIQHLAEKLKRYSIISFDLFDTLAMRRYYFPDYAKLRLGALLHAEQVVPSAAAFVAVRNEVEREIRKERRFKGDVSIKEVYARLAQQWNMSEQRAFDYMTCEFQFDLEHLLSKGCMVDLFNKLHADGKTLWIVSDTYYSATQIHLILKKIGIMVPYELFISNEYKKRKDTGEMWSYLKTHRLSKNSNFIHIGDNIISDAQIPGDFCLAYQHILNPYDKWTMLKMPLVPEDGAVDETTILKWGRLISCMGSNPFLGEL